MAGAEPHSAPGAGLARPEEESSGEGGGVAEEPGRDGEQALVRVAELDEPAGEPLPFSAALARMPVEVDVVVPVRDFRVGNVLALEPGQVIESQWSQGDDVPLTAGEVRLAWTEFEVIEGQLAVRVTRLP